jgi:hypothetical protein
MRVTHGHRFSRAWYKRGQGGEERDPGCDLSIALGPSAPPLHTHEGVRIDACSVGRGASGVQSPMGGRTCGTITGACTARAAARWSASARRVIADSATARTVARGSLGEPCCATPGAATSERFAGGVITRSGSTAIASAARRK